jgi:hypothetical protein
MGYQLLVQYILLNLSVPVHSSSDSGPIPEGLPRSRCLKSALPVCPRFGHDKIVCQFVQAEFGEKYLLSCCDLEIRDVPGGRQQ